MQFLRGLNEQYGNIKSHILLMDPLPLISKIFSYVLQKERKLVGINNVIINLENKVVATAKGLTCMFYGKNGHIESACYRKNGFPNGKGQRRVCTYCGRSGHIIDIC